MVNLSIGPLGIGSPLPLPLPLPKAPIVLDKVLSCIEVGSIPISWSNSFLFVFFILKIGQCCRPQKDVCFFLLLFYYFFIVFLNLELSKTLKKIKNKKQKIIIIIINVNKI